VPLDAWPRQPAGTVIDIGGELEQPTVNRQGSNGHDN
jgi:hypothetical protein